MVFRRGGVYCMKIVLLSHLILVLMPFSAYAGGFQVNLQGVKQTGMGHTGTAGLLDGSTVFFNPAGMGFTERPVSFTGGINFIQSEVHYFNPATQREFGSDNPLSTPFSFYTTFRINHRWDVGYGVYVPYGSTLKWDPQWTGRFLVTDLSLRTFFHQPTLSYRVNGRIGLGAGFIYAHGDVELARDIPVQSVNGQDGQLVLSGSDEALGFVLGAFVRIAPNLDAAIVYRSGMAFEVRDGKADFTVPPVAEAELPDQSFSAKLPVPDITSIGIHWRPWKRLSLYADINLNRWSVYRTLNLDFEKNTQSLDDVSSPRNYSNTRIYRFGVAWTAINRVTLRAGISRDETPVDLEYYSPETPDSDRLSLHGGFSIRLLPVAELDVAFMQVFAEQVEAQFRPEDFSGVYKGGAYLLSVGFNIAF